MASRFHLHSSGAVPSPSNPAFDAGWEQTGQATRLPMDFKSTPLSTPTARTNSSAITVPITTTQQYLCYQHISNQVFRRASLSGTFSMVIRGLEGTTSANVFLAFVLRAFSADGARALATLASSMTNAGTEFAATAATRIFNAVAITAADLNEDWRLVAEIGGHGQAPVAGDTYTYRVGNDAATDFALTSALTTDLNPWLELSSDIGLSVNPNTRGVGTAGIGFTSERGFR